MNHFSIILCICLCFELLKKIHPAHILLSTLFDTIKIIRSILKIVFKTICRLFCSESIIFDGIKNRRKILKRFQNFQNFVFEQALNAKYLQIISHHIHMSFSSMNRLSPNIQLPSPVSFDNYKTKKLIN